MKFKVGDRVRVIDKETISSYLKEGTIVNQTKWSWKVDLDNNEQYYYISEQLELIEEKEMKFKVGDKVRCKVDNNWEEGAIIRRGESDSSIWLIRENCSSHVYYVYEGNMELIENKKYITLADIKACNPCCTSINSSYVMLLEKYGNNFNLTFEQLVKEFPHQKGWIEQNLSQFKEQPVYNGNLKLGNNYYISYFENEKLTFQIIEIKNIKFIKHSNYFEISAKILQTGNTKISNGKEISIQGDKNIFSSLSDLKDHWYKEIDDIKEKDCMSCIYRTWPYNTCKKCGAKEGSYKYWEDKEEKSCETCKKSYKNCGTILLCTSGCDEEYSLWEAIEEEKSCSNCENSETGWECKIDKGKECHQFPYKFWKPKEK